MNYLILTTINHPTKCVKELASGAKRHGWKLLIIGDRKSPSNFCLDGCEFLDLHAQSETTFSIVEIAPTDTYARKNIGYLVAMSKNANLIAETDDDNLPLPTFWTHQDMVQTVRTAESGGWINVYKYFSDGLIWPRGLPLSSVNETIPSEEQLPIRTLPCPVQNGLVDDNPDVDAIYRLLLPLPFQFKSGKPVAITDQASCPFNSQNTRWFPPAYPLLYLPFHCSFRMTDIWRSFVAQRILAENGNGILFHEPTVVQDRNYHDLNRDFSDEVVGYLNNQRIMDRLLDVSLLGRPDTMLSDLESCYESMIKINIISSLERPLITAWRQDVEDIVSRASSV